ncbi:hypothetical protein GWK16_17070 [Roseomonas sp. JC162]|uniref:Uncharacterized protein n=1 Tax=Neoroseomonas marina TaxID=1232220 RepID=A0A848EG07_9PROT|nr:hypothetical protein [Neoroseomonas marina]NMJ42962.1 hypothetical protein [Neoroseomonas marina]
MDRATPPPPDPPPRGVVGGTGRPRRPVSFRTHWWFGVFATLLAVLGLFWLLSP